MCLLSWDLKNKTREEGEDVKARAPSWAEAWLIPEDERRWPRSKVLGAVERILVLLSKVMESFFCYVSSRCSFREVRGQIGFIQSSTIYTRGSRRASWSHILGLKFQPPHSQAAPPWASDLTCFSSHNTYSHHGFHQTLWEFIEGAWRFLLWTKHLLLWLYYYYYYRFEEALPSCGLEQWLRSYLIKTISSSQSFLSDSSYSL